jgi:hypothetical protein
MSFEDIPEDREQAFMCTCGGEITVTEDLLKWVCDSCSFEGLTEEDSKDANSD